ncbi:unnamed protein product [Prorocentrum cordatum]|uniref:60S ribosomal export protein NMD3 n=1 Tax=Prorocentrum cordatum TaxID=2364126 RepID=A0ABN9P8G8_9DINO|nr:unnamed protein product [Polarella glacialis]
MCPQVKTEMDKETFYREAMTSANVSLLQKRIGEAEFEVKIKQLTTAITGPLNNMGNEIKKIFRQKQARNPVPEKSVPKRRKVSAMVRGRAPDAQCDGTCWAEDGRAGRGLGYRAVLLYIKGDWAEFQKTFGLSGWNSIFNPCPCCSAPLDSLHVTYPGFLSSEGLPFPDRDPESYSEACDRCEHTIRIDSQEKLAQVLGMLRFADPESKKVGGLVVVKEVAGIPLMLNDAVLPSPELPDIRLVYSQPVPFDIVFRSWLMVLADARNVKVLLENPSCSIFWHVDSVKEQTPKPRQWAYGLVSFTMLRERELSSTIETSMCTSATAAHGTSTEAGPTDPHSAIHCAGSSADYRTTDYNQFRIDNILTAKLVLDLAGARDVLLTSEALRNLKTILSDLITSAKPHGLELRPTNTKIMTNRARHRDQAHKAAVLARFLEEASARREQGLVQVRTFLAEPDSEERRDMRRTCSDSALQRFNASEEEEEDGDDEHPTAWGGS